MTSNNKAKTYDICIVGLGPAGIGAALTLSNSYHTNNILCIDMGVSADLRSCSILEGRSCQVHNPCQIISGFGGCSLLSSGKVSDYPAGSAIAKIVNSSDFAKNKLKEALNLLKHYIELHKPDISHENKMLGTEYYKNLGFDFKYYDVYRFHEGNLKEAYVQILSDIKAAGMSVMLNTEMIDLKRNANMFEISVNSNGNIFSITTKKIVLGMGRLGAEFVKSLNDKMSLYGSINYLDIGVRLEFPTQIFSDINKYHTDLKLKFNGARTYCVSRDGKIALYYYDNSFYTEGYSNINDLTSLTNIAILQRVPPSENNRAILEELKDNHKKLFASKPVVQNLIDYLKKSNIAFKQYNHTYSVMNAQYGDINKLLPGAVRTLVNESVNYFVSKLLPAHRQNDIYVYAPEVDYANTWFPVKSDFSIAPGLYLIGSSTGQFRGILQAICSGIICAEGIIGNADEKK